MIQQQVYFVHAHVTERGKPDTAPQRFDRGFLATSKDDAEEQMRDYVTDKLPEGCAWDWEVSLYRGGTKRRHAASFCTNAHHLRPLRSN